jgi:transposase
MTMMTHFVGLDVHADSVAIAVATGREEPRSLGTVPSSPKAVYRALTKLAEPEQVLACYEAGPTGFGLQRELGKRGVRCLVIAPSLVPRQAGTRVKTDRRDAQNLARYLRSGDLEAIHVPDEQTEAMRDLERAYGDAKKAQRVARQNLNAFLLRHGRRWSGKTRWTKLHLEWIRKQKFDHEAAERVLVDYLDAVDKANQRLDWLVQSIADLVDQWHQAPLVKALQAFRGIRLLTAATVVAELEDLRRFQKPTKLMAFSGLVPSEHSSGSSRRQGAITKTGNSHLRRVLIETSWCYRFRPTASRCLRERRVGVSKEVLAIAEAAEKRLCGRYRKMRARNKEPQKIVTAIARELLGFIWAVGQLEGPLTVAAEETA